MRRIRTNYSSDAAQAILTRHTSIKSNIQDNYRNKDHMEAHWPRMSKELYQQRNFQHEYHKVAFLNVARAGQ